MPVLLAIPCFLNPKTIVGHRFRSVSVPVLLAIPCFLSPKTVMLGTISGQDQYQCLCCWPSLVSSVPKLSCWALFQDSITISVFAASHLLFVIPVCPQTVMSGIVSGQYQHLRCLPCSVYYYGLPPNCHVRHHFRSVSASALLTVLFIIPVCPQTIMSGIISGQYQHLRCLPPCLLSQSVPKLSCQASFQVSISACAAYHLIYYPSLSPNCHVGHHFRSVPVPVLLAISCLLSQSVPEPSCWVSFQVSINVSACFLLFLYPSVHILTFGALFLVSVNV